MYRLSCLLLLVFALGLLVIGCSESNNPLTENEYGEVSFEKGSVVLNSAELVSSATFHVYVAQASGQDVNVHRITADWMESSVTWNNFGGAYMPEIIATFTADMVGWYEVDITSLVQDWQTGTYENYGFLIAHNELGNPRTVYNSRENLANNPYLEVCYGMNPCENVLPTADATISEYYPDQNFGYQTLLLTGWPDPFGVEKQSMFRFEVEPADEEEGCTLTIGYWKNHAGLSKQADMITPLLNPSVWLGDEGGDKSLEVTDKYMAVDILEMKTYGNDENMITKLYAQLLATKLNILNGAGDLAVAEAIAEADAFLADHDWNDWGSMNETEKDYLEGLKNLFDDYNNGIIGPGHCE
ncbi:MAG: DNRLRE domain-containing protein [Candidatus Zixiibacteriota bacterium]